MEQRKVEENGKQAMDTANVSGSGQNSVQNFDYLSREELLGKYQVSLALARKAKLSKDATIEELKSTKQELQNAQEERQQAISQQKVLEEMLSHFTEDKMALTTKVESLQRQLKLSQNETDLLHETERSLLENTVTLTRENKKWETELSEREKNFSNLISENESSKNEIQNLNSRLNSLKEELTKSKKVIDEQESTLSNTTKVKMEAELVVIELHQKLAKSKEEIAEMKVSMGQLVTDLQESVNAFNVLQQEKEKIENTLKEAQEGDHEVMTVWNEAWKDKEEVMTALNEANKKKDEMMTALNEAQKEKEEMITAVNEAQTEKQEAVTALNEAQQEKEEMITAVNEAQTEKQEAVTALNEAQQEKEEMITAVNEAQTEKQEAVTTLNEAQQEKEEMITAVNEAQAEKQEAVTALNEAQKEKEEMITAVNEAQKEKEEAVTTLYEAQKEKEEMMTAVNEAQKEKEEAVTALIVTQKEKEEMLTAVNEAQKEKNEILAALNKALTEKQDVLSAIDKVKKEKEEMVTVWKESQIAVEKAEMHGKELVGDRSVTVANQEMSDNKIVLSDMQLKLSEFEKRLVISVAEKEELMGTVSEMKKNMSFLQRERESSQILVEEITRKIVAAETSFRDYLGENCIESSKTMSHNGNTRMDDVFGWPELSGKIDQLIVVVNRAKHGFSKLRTTFERLIEGVGVDHKLGIFELGGSNEDGQDSVIEHMIGIFDLAICQRDHVMHLLSMVIDHLDDCCHYDDTYNPIDLNQAVGEVCLKVVDILTVIGIVKKNEDKVMNCTTKFETLSRTLQQLVKDRQMAISEINETSHQLEELKCKLADTEDHIIDTNMNVDDRETLQKSLLGLTGSRDDLKNACNSIIEYKNSLLQEFEEISKCYVTAQFLPVVPLVGSTPPENMSDNLPAVISGFQLQAANEQRDMEAMEQVIQEMKDELQSLHIRLGNVAADRESLLAQINDLEVIVDDHESEKQQLLDVNRTLLLEKDNLLNANKKFMEEKEQLQNANQCLVQEKELLLNINQEAVNEKCHQLGIRQMIAKEKEHLLEINQLLVEEKQSCEKETKTLMQKNADLERQLVMQMENLVKSEVSSPISECKKDNVDLVTSCTDDITNDTVNEYLPVSVKNLSNEQEINAVGRSEMVIPIVVKDDSLKTYHTSQVQDSTVSQNDLPLVTEASAITLNDSTLNILNVTPQKAIEKVKEGGAIVKELDGTAEERYNKLKNVALGLKKKLNEAKLQLVASEESKKLLEEDMKLQLAEMIGRLSSSEDSRHELQNTCYSFREQIETVQMRFTDTMAQLQVALRARSNLEERLTAVEQERELMKTSSNDNFCVMEKQISNLKSDLAAVNFELETVKCEFEGFKVRAHNVLRMKEKSSTEKNIDEDMASENTHLKSSLESVHSQLQQLQCEKSRQENELRFSQTEQERLHAEMISLREESKRNITALQQQLATVVNKADSRLAECQLTISALTNQNEVLKANYKKEMDSLHALHTKEIADSQKQLERTEENLWKLQKSSAPIQQQSLVVTQQQSLLCAQCEQPRLSPFANMPVIQPVVGYEEPVIQGNMVDMIREEAEGSEFIESSTRNRPDTYTPPSLEQLISRSTVSSVSVDDTISIGSFFNDPTGKEVSMLEAKLVSSEMRFQQLSSLLHESEGENAKLTLLCNALKEEIRRGTRNESRERHLENIEYAKNVILKFLVLPSGPDRTRLVPVLKTVLQLSQDELKKLEEISKGNEGTGGNAGWGLHLWSGR